MKKNNFTKIKSILKRMDIEELKGNSKLLKMVGGIEKLNAYIEYLNNLPTPNILFDTVNIIVSNGTGRDYSHTSYDVEFGYFFDSEYPNVVFTTSNVAGHSLPIDKMYQETFYKGFEVDDIVGQYKKELQSTFVDSYDSFDGDFFGKLHK